MGVRKGALPRAGSIMKSCEDIVPYCLLNF
jgi:hypothetical protein